MTDKPSSLSRGAAVEPGLPLKVLFFGNVAGGGGGGGGGVAQLLCNPLKSLN